MNEGQKLLSLLGLCQKAGKLASGETPCENAIRKGEAKVVVLSQDASNGTKKKFSGRCHYYQVPLIVLPYDKEQIGRAVGKELRSCAAVCEEGFAKQILDYNTDMLQCKE